MDAKKALQSTKRNHCQHAKPKVQSWQEFFLQDLLDALDSAGCLGCCACKQALASRRRKELACAKGAFLCERICGRSAWSAVLWADFLDPTRALWTLCAQLEMVRAMADSNVRRQKQCQGTSSMSEPILSAFGCLADTPVATAILDGTHDLPRGLDPFLGEFRACLRRPANLLHLGNIPAAVTPNQNRTAWQHQHERKAGSLCVFLFHKAASLLPALNTVNTVL